MTILGLIMFSAGLLTVINAGGPVPTLLVIVGAYVAIGGGAMVLLGGRKPQ